MSGPRRPRDEKDKPVRQRYKRREVDLPDGGKLVLRGDGSIRQLSGDGTAVDSWSPDDPAWESRAFRFGIQYQPTTIKPSGRNMPGTDRPR